MKFFFLLSLINFYTTCLADNCNFLSKKENYFPPRQLQASKLNWLQKNLYNNDENIDEQIKAMLDEASENTSYKAKLYFLYSMRIKKTDEKKSFNYLEKAIDTNKLSKSDKIFSAKVLLSKMLAERKYDSALFCSNLISKVAPNETDYYFISAQLLAGKKRWKEAKNKCIDGFNRNKSFNENFFKLCEVVYKKNKDYSNALIITQELIIKDDKNENYWLEKSYLLKKLGKNLEAYTNLKLAYLKGILKKETSIKNMIYSELNIGLPFLAYEDMKSLDTFDEEIKISSLLKAKAYEKLIARLEEKKESLDSKQIKILSELYLYKRDYKNAAIILEKMLSMKIETDKTLYQLARVYYYLDQPKKALEYFKKSEKKENKMAQAWVNFITTTSR